MTQSPKPWLLRIAIAIAAVFAGSIGLVAVTHSEPIHPAVVLNCLTTGEGLGIVSPTGEDFEADMRGHRYVGNTGNAIDLYVYLIGAWEPHVLDLMQDLLVDVEDGKGVFLDVGANTGVHSMFASTHAAEVHAIEPWPPVVDRMKSMVQLNSIDNVVVHELGYADEPGTLPYFEPTDRNLGGGSFSKDSITTPGRTIDLPLVKGDDHLSESGVERIDLMKMDIQGYEKPALAGLRKTMVRDRPFVIMELEVHEKEKLGFFSEQELRDAYPDNYSFFSIGEIGKPGMSLPLWSEKVLICWDPQPEYRLRPLEMKFVDDGSSKNMLAVPNERLEELKTKLANRFVDR